MLDNYDSFTFNLVQYLGELGVEVETLRNDSVTVDEVVERQAAGIVISPGPCTPDDAGICLELIERLAPSVPIFGVCLGHQCIGQAFGARVIRAPRIMHGKTSMIEHSGESVFAGLPNPFEATRYHSLIVDNEGLPDCFEVTAWTEYEGEREIMGLQHRDLPLAGVQFHPESILTAHGHDMLKNFLERTSQ